jgi:hypothetical protein
MFALRRSEWRTGLSRCVDYDARPSSGRLRSRNALEHIASCMGRSKNECRHRLWQLEHSDVCGWHSALLSDWIAGFPLREADATIPLQMIVCWRCQARPIEPTMLILQSHRARRREGDGHRLGEGDSFAGGMATHVTTRRDPEWRKSFAILASRLR